MRPRRLLVAAALLAFVLASQSHTFSTPEDTPLAAVTLLYSAAPNASRCLGAVVASNVVLTPARCVRGALGTLWTAQFVRRASRSSRRLVTVQKIPVASIELPMGDDDGDSFERAMALVRLYRPYTGGQFTVVKQDEAPAAVSGSVLSVLSIDPTTLQFHLQHPVSRSQSDDVSLPSEISVDTTCAINSAWSLLVGGATAASPSQPSTLYGFSVPPTNASSNASVFGWLPTAGGALVSEWTSDKPSDSSSYGTLVLRPDADADADAADPSAAPSYMAGLRMAQDDATFCGGSLISPTVVLTAAHCVDGGIAPGFVSIGSRYTAGEANPGEQLTVQRVLVHPHYDSVSKANDLALVVLSSASTSTPIRLENGARLSASCATVFGYGVTHDGGTEMSPTLRSVELPLIPSRSQCESQFGAFVDASLFCAGGEQGRDACTGDSGGPLVLDPDGTPSLIGVVSAGNACGVQGRPGLYAWVGSASAMAFVSAHVADAVWTTTVTINGVAIPVGPATAHVSYPQLTHSAVARPGTVAPPSPLITPLPSGQQPGELFTVQLPDDLTKFTQLSLLHFLTNSEKRQSNPNDAATTSVRFTLLSTAHLEPLVQIIQYHDASALHRRRDRAFVRQNSSSGTDRRVVL